MSFSFRADTQCLAQFLASGRHLENEYDIGIMQGVTTEARQLDYPGSVPMFD